jgi:uncharacterized protein (TIGR02145 family)
VVFLGLIIAKGAYAANPAAVVDNLSVTVESNCGITHSGSGTYTKTINPGSSSTITANTVTAVCNDDGGYAIYAIGYSGDSFEENNTDLISNNNSDWNIKTDGSYQGSFWKMKFSATGDATVTSPYTTYQQIPSSYAKVASYNEYTTGGVITPIYQISLGQGQPAGTYEGKVQYVLVNPSSADTPVIVTTMQNLLAANCTSTPRQVRDTRDDHVYTVQRLLDGKCWMMENLDLGRTELTIDLTSLNTNVANVVTASSFNSWKKTLSSNTYTSGEFISLDGIDSTSRTMYGTLYNYCAISAGTICSSSDNNNNNATSDLCPAGWRLPTGGSSGEFQALYNLTNYNSFDKMQAPITNGGAAFALTGYYNGTKTSYQGSQGYYWSSTRTNDTNMFSLRLHSSNLSPTYYNVRSYGYAVRCIADF